jgi:hypothetical protein
VDGIGSVIFPAFGRIFDAGPALRACVKADMDLIRERLKVAEQIAKELSK